VIGQGRDRRRLERQAVKLSLSGRVSFIDPVDDELFCRWLKTAAVYVSLSSHEAFGLAVAEAAIAGAGVVVSDIPPHRELARLLGTGRFEFLPDNHGLALAQAIMRTERQPPDPTEPEHLSWERTAAETHELYEAVVERSR
jgi:glycosyltransferase involved in cell wall biosynthesis